MINSEVFTFQIRNEQILLKHLANYLLQGLEWEFAYVFLPLSTCIHGMGIYLWPALVVTLL